MKKQPIHDNQETQSTPPQDEVTVLQNRIQDLELQLEHATNQWKRALADYQNLEKRSASERQQWIKQAARDCISELLPVFDSFQQATNHLQDRGLQLALQQLQSSLQKIGVTKVVTANKEFDPQTMEVVDVINAEHDNVVVHELRSGYLLHDTLLRPAQVRVGRNGEHTKEDVQD